MPRLPRTSETWLLDELAALRRRVQQLEDSTPVTISFVDETTGLERVRVGLQDDDTWGIRVWNAAGSLVHDVTFA